AEDGIRDYKVTGVQTCALPILSHRRALRRVSGHAPVLDRTLAVERGGETVGYRALDLRVHLVGVDHVAAVEGEHEAVHLELALRSEERRVGKEWISRWMGAEER